MHFREIKQTDSHLDQIEQAIELESRRIERLHPLEAKKVADQIDHDLVVTEQAIQSLKVDVNTLRSGRYPQAGELDKRVNKLHEKWVRLRHALHNKIVGPLANMSFPVEERTVTKHIRTVQETRNIETNPHFRSLQEHIEWCKNKLVSWWLITKLWSLIKEFAETTQGSRLWNWSAISSTRARYPSAGT